MLDTLVPTREDISYALTLDGMIGFSTIVVVVLWIYMPGYLANTFAMIWGRLPPKFGYGPWPIDFGPLTFRLIGKEASRSSPIRQRQAEEC